MDKLEKKAEAEGYPSKYAYLKDLIYRELGYSLKKEEHKDNSIIEFEEKNFKNMLNFYHDELITIDEGKISTSTLTHKERMRLIRYGILERKPIRPTILELSEKARNLLMNEKR